MTRVQRIPSGLLNVSEIDSSRAHRLSFLRHHFRTVLAVQGSSAAPIGAPWTAPGRSEQHFPTRGKARKKKSSAALRLPLVGDDPAPHNGTPTTDRERAGLNATTKVRLQLGGEILFLTFPLIEPKGCRFESYLRSQHNSLIFNVGHTPHAVYGVCAEASTLSQITQPCSNFLFHDPWGTPRSPTAAAENSHSISIADMGQASYRSAHAWPVPSRRFTVRSTTIGLHDSQPPDNHWTWIRSTSVD